MQHSFADLRSWFKPLRHQRPLRLIAAIAIAVVASVPAVHAICTVYAVVATVPVGGFPFGIAVHESTDRIYVTHSLSSAMTVLNASTGQVVASIPAGPGSGITINPTTGLVYVAGGQARAVFVVDGLSQIATIPIPPASGFTSLQPIVANPATNTIYVVAVGGRICCPSPNSVLYAIDGFSNTVIGSVTVGEFSLDVALNPVTNRVYVANSGSSTISVIEGDSLALLDTIPIDGPISLDVNGVTNRIHVAHNLSDGTTVLSIVDGATHEILSTTPARAASTTGSLTVDSSRNLVYLATILADTVSVYDGNTQALLRSIPVAPGSGPVTVDISAATDRVYIAQHYAGTVSTADAIGADQSAQLLIDAVNNLVASGQLQDGHGKALTFTLEQIRAKLEAGGDHSQASAISLLKNAFSQKIEAFMKSGHLGTSAGQALLRQASFLASQIAHCE